MIQISPAKITFEPARFWCLHVGDQDHAEILFRKLAERFDADGVKGVLSSVANLDAVRRRFPSHPTVVEWLSQNSDLSPDDAAKVIAQFPISVAPRLSQNAMNPRRFLGLAAAIARRPQVIVYSTAGMDPYGVELIHKYAAANFALGCLIHVSVSTIASSPTCPAAAQCATIE